jgi:Mg2+-importing ATPase
VFHSGWFTENLLTQALVMLLLRLGRRGVEGRRKPGPVGWGAAALTAVGLALPLSPLGPPLGMTALPVLYYLLLAAVLGLYAVGLVATRSRYERRRSEDQGEGECEYAHAYVYDHGISHSDQGPRGERIHDGG